MSETTDSSCNVIKITNLDFQYDDNRKIFKNLSYSFKGENCYVICGRNGSGKSTLLELLAGKKLAKSNTISVDGIDPFRNTRINGIACLLNNQWGMRTVAYCGYNLPLQSSIKVKEMMISRKKLYPEREKELREVLSINTEWSLNGVSEGQRKRIQLYLGLLVPFKVLLMDEITVNLDVIVKSRFMDFLKKEARRGCCVLYVTHIFDGLDNWCDYVLYLNDNGIEETKIDNIKDKNIYLYILDKFNRDITRSITSKSSNISDIIVGNAGGYANGTLNNFNYKK